MVGRPFFHDNGLGFDHGTLEPSSKPFQQFDTTRQSYGHGIGLVTVERIIRRHGGHIWAESEAGEGATCFFTLVVRCCPERLASMGTTCTVLHAGLACQPCILYSKSCCSQFLSSYLHLCATER